MLAWCLLSSHVRLSVRLSQAGIVSKWPIVRHVTFYCTWRPSALTTGPHGQNVDNFEILFLCRVPSYESQCSFQREMDEKDAEIQRMICLVGDRKAYGRT